MSDRWVMSANAIKECLSMKAEISVVEIYQVFCNECGVVYEESKRICEIEAEKHRQYHKNKSDAAIKEKK